MDDLACFIEKRAHPDVAEHILVHLDDCEKCRLLLAATLRESALDFDQTSVPACAPRTFPVGEVVGGRYRIKRMISRGGMGEVYEAWDAQLSEAVALKTIICTGLDNATLYVRIRKEVQLARKVTHPNVCRILEFGLHQQSYRSQTEVIPFFTMELLNGSTLAEYVARRGRVPTTELLPIITQLLNGLAAIHSAGIVHRDLKPENIFILSNGTADIRAVVMDFGLARIQDTCSSVTESSSGSMVGTPSYMAPEQTMGGTPSVAWDIYSLGVVLFRAIAGELPFTGSTAVALAMARVKNPAPALSSVVPDTDPGLEDIVARCLERNPAHRYASVEEIQLAVAYRQSGKHLRGPTRVFKAVVLAVGMVATVGAVAWSLRNQTLQRETNARAIKIQSNVVPADPSARAPQQTRTLLEQSRTQLLSQALGGSMPPAAERETVNARAAPAQRSTTVGAAGANMTTFRSAIPVSTALAKKKQSLVATAPSGSHSTGVSSPRVQSDDDIAIPVFAGPPLSSRGRGAQWDESETRSR